MQNSKKYLYKGKMIMTKKNIGIFAVAVLAYSLLCFNTTIHAQEQQEITISAAISLKNAFEDIGKQFETKHQGVNIYFNFAASGDLMKQIEAGAPIDIFASASTKEMDELKQKGILLNDFYLSFALNEIILIEPYGTQLKIKSFDDLTKAGVKRIAIGNPKTVPAGRYAQEVLTYFKLWDIIRDKLILGENVRQVLDYVARGEVDTGVVYATDAPAMANKIRIAVEAPAQSHKPVVYPIAVLKQAKNNALAETFIDFVTTDAAKSILKKYGFKPVN